jgi:hypothetical protein
MAFLKRRNDPITEAERTISEQPSRRVALATRLQAAEAELAQALDARRALLLDGDLDDDGTLASGGRLAAEWRTSRARPRAGQHRAMHLRPDVLAYGFERRNGQLMRAAKPDPARAVAPFERRCDGGFL